jgi:quinol monooxygenase YgiN
VTPRTRRRLRAHIGEETTDERLSYKAGMSMVIVQGAFAVKPDERDRFLEATTAGIRSSRAEEGCLEYVMAADPLDPGRVVLSERWESMEHLEQHLKGIGARRSESSSASDARPASLGQQITIYTVVETRSL